MKRGRKPLKRGKGFAVSPAQREKVRDALCIVCGRDRYEATIDPAHVVSRPHGGCDDPLCVVPLCRQDHTSFDTGRLDLLPYLEPRFRDELAHAIGHVGLVGLLRRVCGRDYEEAA